MPPPKFVIIDITNGGKMKKKGFTLAEVLITLVVIGVVAAITVPVINSQIATQEMQNRLKKSIFCIRTGRV